MGLGSLATRTRLPLAFSFRTSLNLRKVLHNAVSILWYLLAGRVCRRYICITIPAEYMHSAPLVNFFFYAKESQIMPYKALGSMFITFAACSYLPELSYDPAEGVQLCKHSIFYLFFLTNTARAGQVLEPVRLSRYSL